MVSSLLMFGSSYKKYNKLSIMCYIIMLANLFIVQFGKVSGIFFMVNLAIFLIMPLLVNRIQNKYLNALASVSTILIWSIIIDFISYYLFPNFVGNASLIAYIGRGVAFNFRYVITNVIVLIGMNAYSYLSSSVKTNKVTNKNLVISS